MPALDPDRMTIQEMRSAYGSELVDRMEAEIEADERRAAAMPAFVGSLSALANIVGANRETLRRWAADPSRPFPKRTSKGYNVHLAILHRDMRATERDRAADLSEGWELIRAFCERGALS